MKIVKTIFDRRGGPLLAVIFVLLFVAERRRQLRKRVQPVSQRVITNSLLGIASFTLLRFLFLPVIVRLAIANNRWKTGFNHLYEAPATVKGMVAFLLMDYTNYLWHILNHKVSLLWRFHLVHHCDLDVDITTATRFHFGELIGSVFYRGFFVLAAGAAPAQVLLYEILFEGATQFHHSNLKLPFGLETALNKLVVTPRMHGIHHSSIKREADSNYSVILSIWDRLHSTIRLNVGQNSVVIGVPSYSNPDELSAGYLLKLPFTKIRSWGVHQELKRANEPAGTKNGLAR